MKTAASAVENYIRSKPFLQSALSQGIINLTSLARMIQPEIQKDLGREVRSGAIVMALKRLSEDMEFRLTHRIVKVLKHIGEITVRSALSDYTYRISDSILDCQAQLIAEVQKDTELFYTTSRGVQEINIVVSSRLGERVERLFEKEECTQKKEGLSSITVKLPSENVMVPGVYYFIFQRLAWEGVLIYEVISTTHEFTILVDEDQVERAFKTIKDLKHL